MKRYMNMVLAAVVVVFAGCSGNYDDARIRKDIDDMGKELAELERTVEGLNDQMTALNSLVNSKFITFISKDADGRYVISFKDGGDGEVRTITIATSGDVVTAPIIGVGQHTDSEYYWRYTTDGGGTYQWLPDVDETMIPVGGRTPEIGIDDDGYWTVNDVRITGKGGQPVLAHETGDSLFSSVAADPDNGRAVFTLADGTVLEIQMFESLGIRFDAAPVTVVPDRSQTVRINYTLYGTDAVGAVVDFFTAYNVTAEIDESLSAIFIKMDAGAESGNVVVMAHANGNTVMKPLFFTYGTAGIDDPVPDPEYAVGGEVLLEGGLTTFDIKVSSNIDYEVTVDGESRGWLLYNSTKAPMVTLTHTFTAEYYDNPAGTVRRGVITFSNRAYNISSSITVKQNPVTPVETDPGIATAADFIAFANAVNMGAGTSRWEDETGAVVLLNDIDMSEVTEWTPIGSVEEGYRTVNPFKGTFDGKGFSVTGLKWIFDVKANDKKIGYGLFGALEGATVRNLTVGSAAAGDVFTVTGITPKNFSVAGVAGYSENSTIENVTNYVDVSLTGDNPVGIQASLAGIAGTMKGGTVGGKSRPLGCVNNGNITTGKISNDNNGGNGMTVGGLVGFVLKSDAKISYSVNRGDVSAPTGRGGGLVGTCDSGGSIDNCENFGQIEDDVVGQFEGRAKEFTYNYKRMGGLVGGLLADTRLEYCTNNGNVFTHLACRTGGFVGHSNGVIVACVNKGVILGDLFADASNNRHGPGWACGYSQASSGDYVNVSSCTRGGKVGGWTEFKGNPSSAPEATSDNAFCHRPESFDPGINY